MAFQSLQRPLSERNDPQGVRRLPVRANVPADEHAPDVQNLRGLVDVAPLEREELRGTEPGQGADERKRA